MQVTVENTGTLERRLTVQIPADEVQQQVDARLREIGKQVRIKGFRPGRIPHSVLRQRYGKQVRQEIVAQTMQTSLQDAIRQEELRPASAPRLDQSPDLASKGDLEFTAIVEVFPELDEIDVGGIEIVKPEAAVTEDDVDDMLTTLREQRQQWDDVSRSPADGDRVVAEYVAEADGARIPENGEHRLDFILGTSGFEAIEKVLSALEPGQETDVELAFPDNYARPELAGVEAQVELSLVEVKEGRMPEIDEDFVRSFGIQSGDVDELRTEIRQNLERELKQSVTNQMRFQLIDGLIATQPELEVPESLVQQEVAGMQQQAMQSQGGEGEPPAPEMFTEAAQRRVKGGLLVADIARQNNIVIDGARVREAIDTVAETYEQPQDVVQMYYSDQRLLQAVERVVLEEQVVDWALEHAQVRTEPKTFKEVIAVTAAG